MLIKSSTTCFRMDTKLGMRFLYAKGSLLATSYNPFNAADITDGSLINFKLN